MIEQDVDARGRDGFTLLMAAAESGHVPEAWTRGFAPVERNCLAVMEALIRAGADVNAETNVRPPLHHLFAASTFPLNSLLPRK